MMNMNSNDRNIVNRNKIQEIVNQIDPRHTLDPEVEEILLEVVDEFMDSVTGFACALAKHRNSDSLQVRDLQVHLQNQWGMKIPGFMLDDASSIGGGGDASSTTHLFINKRPLTEVHKERIKMVKSSEMKWQRTAKKATTTTTNTNSSMSSSSSATSIPTNTSAVDH